MGYYEGDLCLTNNGNNGGMFGNNGDWIWAFLLFALIGNNGWGGVGYGGGYRGEACATQADVRAAVDQQTLICQTIIRLHKLFFANALLFSELPNSLLHRATICYAF